MLKKELHLHVEGRAVFTCLRKGFTYMLMVEGPYLHVDSRAVLTC
jgi:hypothetical protein